MLTHVLEALSLLLHWVVIAATAEEDNLLSLDFRSLTLCWALYEHALYADARACGNLLEDFILYDATTDNNLDVLDGRTIVELNEVNSLA